MAESVAHAFGSRLRRAREAQGWTQAELAERIGLATEAYGRLERGRSLPRADTLVHLAQALHISTDYLLGLEDDLIAREAGGSYEATDSPDIQRAVRLLRALPPRTVSAIAMLLATLAADADGP